MFSQIKRLLHRKELRRDDIWIFGSVGVAGVIMLIASLVLSIDSLELAKNPNVQLSCNINPIISCGTVAQHPSASILGFPNSYIGMMAAPIVIFIAFTGIIGVKYPRQFLRIIDVGFWAGLLFAAWMFITSYAVIGVLCPWCLTVTASMIVAFFGHQRYMIREGVANVPKRAIQPLQRYIANDYDKVVLVGLLVAITAAILIKYGDGLFA